MPVVRTGVIPTCRSPSLPAVTSLSHGPRDCLASFSHLANDRPMHYRFFTFWPRGTNSSAKVHQRGDDLVDSEIYHPAKFHHSMPIHTRDIRYQKSCGQKNKQTVNDISRRAYWHVGDNKQEIQKIQLACTKPNPRLKQFACKNCSYRRAYDCAQLGYTIQHRTVHLSYPPDKHHSSDVV